MRKYFFINKSIVVLIILISAMLFSCSDEIPVVKRINSKEDLPSISIENLKSSYTENGMIKAKLITPLLNNYDEIEEPYIKFPKGINILMFDKQGKIESSISANHAIYKTKVRLWEATGNVVLKNTSGDTLRTEKLYGNENEGKIYTDKFVSIIKSDGTLIKGAKGFESNTKFTIYKFFDISGKIFIHDNDEADTTVNVVQPQKIKPKKIEEKEKINNLKRKKPRKPLK